MMETSDLHYVRTTTLKACEMYTQVKNSSSYLKGVVENVESRVPASWVEGFAARSDPLIDGLDSQIGQVAASATALYTSTSGRINAQVIDPLNIKVITPAKEVAARYASTTSQLKEQVASRVVEQVNKNVVVPATEAASSATAMYTATSEQLKKSVSTRVIDPVNTKLVVPVKDVAAKTSALYKTGEWKSVRGDLSKKAIQRLETGLVRVKEFSATRGKEIIHFDLIEYSKEILDNASAAAKPVYEPIQERLAAAVVKVNTSIFALQESILEKSTQTTEQYETVRANLTERLHAAMAAARELSAYSVEYVQNTYTVVKTGTGEYAAYVPKAINDATAFILSSPSLFLEVKAKADIDTSKRAIDNARSLLDALRTVLLPATKAQAAKSA